MFDPDSDPRWRFLLSAALEERTKAEMILCHLYGVEDLIQGADYEVEETTPPAAPGTVWFVFPDSGRYWRAVDILDRAGIVPLVMDDIVSIQIRRERLGLPNARCP